MIEITDGHDPRLSLLLEGTAYPDEDRLDLVVLDLEHGQPVAAMAGFQWGPVPLLEHLSVAPHRFSCARLRRLLAAFVAEATRRWGGTVIVTALAPVQPQIDLLRTVCRHLGGVVYARDAAREWVAFYRKEPRR